MKFLRIEIEHVFAYDKLAFVDLSGTTDDRNIILIWGRNGMGKTKLPQRLEAALHRRRGAFGSDPWVFLPALCHRSSL